MASRINRVGSFPFPPYLILTVFQLSSFSHVFIKRTKISKADLHFSESCSIISEYDPLDHDRLHVTYSASLYVEPLQRELWELAFTKGSLGNWSISVWTFWAMVTAQNGGCSCFLPLYFILNGPFDMWTSGICSSYRPPPMRDDIFYGVDDIPWETYHHEIFLLFNNSDIMNIREYYRSIVTVSFMSMIRLQHV